MKYAPVLLQVQRVYNPFYISFKEYFPTPLPLSLSQIHFEDVFNSPLNIKIGIYEYVRRFFNTPAPTVVLPPNLTTITFGLLFNLSSNHWNNLPSTVREIKFVKKSQFNQRVDNLPNSITHLTFGYEFNQIIDNLPSSLIYLKLGKKFNRQINKLPSSLQYLIFGSAFNLPISISLPVTLIHLEFGTYFNYSIDDLPPSLTYLKFGHNFSNEKYIQLPFPSNLTHLYLGSGFNSSLASILPPKIKNLSFGKPSYGFLSKFNQPLYSLPPYLHTLTLTGNFNQSIDNDLPNTLVNLTIAGTFNQQINFLPPSLTHLTIGGYFNQQLYLPPHLTHLIFEKGDFNRPLDNLPISLTHLFFKLRSHFNFPLLNLPPNLTHLILGLFFDNELKLPSSLLFLCFGAPFRHWKKIYVPSNEYESNDYSRPLPPLPPYLTHLYLHDKYNHFSSEVNLPPSITHLQLGFPIHPIDSLPPNLTHLSLNEYNFALPPLPDSLLYLHTGSAYNHPINSFPPNLIHLFLSLVNKYPLPNFIPSSVRSIYIPAEYKFPIPKHQRHKFFIQGSHLNLDDGWLPKRIFIKQFIIVAILTLIQFLINRI